MMACSKPSLAPQKDAKNQDAKNQDAKSQNAKNQDARRQTSPAPKQAQRPSSGPKSTKRPIPAWLMEQRPIPRQGRLSKLSEITLAWLDQRLSVQEHPAYKRILIDLDQAHPDHGISQSSLAKRREALQGYLRLHRRGKDALPQRLESLADKMLKGLEAQCQQGSLSPSLQIQFLHKLEKIQKGLACEESSEAEKLSAGEALQSIFQPWWEAQQATQQATQKPTQQPKTKPAKTKPAKAKSRPKAKAKTEPAKPKAKPADPDPTLSCPKL